MESRLLRAPPGYIPGSCSNASSKKRYFIALRASAAVPPLICALEADLGATGAGRRAVDYGAAGSARAKGRQRHYAELLPYYYPTS